MTPLMGVAGTAGPAQGEGLPPNQYPWNAVHPRPSFLFGAWPDLVGRPIAKKGMIRADAFAPVAAFQAIAAEVDLPPISLFLPAATWPAPRHANIKTSAKRRDFCAGTVSGVEVGLRHQRRLKSPRAISSRRPLMRQQP